MNREREGIADHLCGHILFNFPLYCFCLLHVLIDFRSAHIQMKVNSKMFGLTHLTLANIVGALLTMTSGNTLFAKRHPRLVSLWWPGHIFSSLNC